MKKQLIVGMSAIMLLTACGHKDEVKQSDPNSVKVDKNEVTKQVEIQPLQPLDEKSDEQVKEKQTSEVNVDAVVKDMDRLHDFVAIDNKVYPNVKKSLESKGVKIKSDLSKPYTEFTHPDGSNADVLRAGIYVDKKVDKRGNEVHVTYTTRTGHTAYDGDINDAVANIKEVLRDDAQENLNKKVEYVLTVAKDKKSAELELKTKNWWVNE